MLGFAVPGFAQTGTDRYDESFRKYSKRFFGPGFDWRLFKAQAMAESGLDPNAASWAGARGLMQLMPMTFQEVQSRNPEFVSIDDPVWNIAAGICYDRQLWIRWADLHMEEERIRFVLGSYNAGRGTLLRARSVAESRQLDPRLWTNIRTIAPAVPRWRHAETLGYVDRIEANLTGLCAPGRPAVFSSFTAQPPSSAPTGTRPAAAASATPPQPGSATDPSEPAPVADPPAAPRPR